MEKQLLKRECEIDRKNSMNSKKKDFHMENGKTVNLLFFIICLSGKTENNWKKCIQFCFSTIK